MKLLACFLMAIFAVIATVIDKDAMVEDFGTRCLLMGGMFNRLSSMFSSLNCNQQQITYPATYPQDVVYYYYPVYENQEIIYEYYPGTEYAYTYPPYQYQVWQEPQFGTEQPIYYYNRMMPNGSMKKEQVNKNFYDEMKRRNGVMEKRQIERFGTLDYSQLPPQPTREQVIYDQKYQEYPRSEQQEVVYQRPAQQEQVYRPSQTYQQEQVYRPSQTYEQEQVVYRPAQTYETQQVVYGPAQPYESQQVVYRPAQPYESQQVVYRPAAQPARVQMVAVQQQKSSPMQSLFGLGSRTQQQPILVSGQQAKNLAARSQ